MGDGAGVEWPHWEGCYLALPMWACLSQLRAVVGTSLG